MQNLSDGSIFAMVASTCRVASLGVCPEGVSPFGGKCKPARRNGKAGPGSPACGTMPRESRRQAEKAGSGEWAGIVDNCGKGNDLSLFSPQTVLSLAKQLARLWGQL